MGNLQILSVTHFDSTGTLYFDVFVQDDSSTKVKRFSVSEYLALFEEPVQAEKLLEKLRSK